MGMYTPRKQYLGEMQSIRTVQGVSLPFTGEVYLLSSTGYGMPRVSYQTRKGYKQMGETIVDFQLGRRILNVTLKTLPNTDRDSYWADRAKLLETFNPSTGMSTTVIGNELTLTVSRKDASKRAIKCWYQSGLEFEDDIDISDNSFSIDPTITLIAPNPIWYNPSLISQSVAGGVSENLIFPITFPILFGETGANFTYSYTYGGTWRSYPKITITGPYTTARIDINGIFIKLGVAISSSQQRIIDLNEEGFSITDGNGNSKFSELVSGSNLVDAYIPPLDSGNVIISLLNGIPGTSIVTIEYYERYIGI